MEIVKSENLKEEVTNMDSLSRFSVSYDIKHKEQKNFRYDMPPSEVGISLEYKKQEEGVKEEEVDSYNTEMSIKTESNDTNDELDIQEHRLSYEHLKSNKIEGYKIDPTKECTEHTTAKSYVLLDRLKFNDGQHVNDMEINKHEEKSGNADTSVVIEVDTEKVKVPKQYNTEMSIKTERNETKYEIDIQEHGVSYEQLKSNKTEDYKIDLSKEYMEHTAAKSYVLLDRLKFNYGQYVNDMEIIKHESNVGNEYTSNGIEVDMEKLKVPQQYDADMSIEPERNETKYEIDIQEHGLSYEQLKSIKIEDNKIDPSKEYMEHTAAKCYVLLDRLELDSENIDERDISTGIEADTEKQNVVQPCQPKYGIEDEARNCRHKTNIKRHKSSFSADKKAKSALQAHTKETYKENVKYLKCKLCEYTTNRSYSLNSHITRKHNENDELFHCFTCNYKTKVKSDLVKHWRLHHSKINKRYQCHLCDFITRSRPSFVLHHKVRHDGGETFNCALCDFKTKNKAYFVQHHKSKHDAASIFHCEVCEFRTKVKRNLLQHHRLKHDVAEFLHCELCDFKTKSKHYLPVHYRIKHDNVAETFHCKLCDFKTKNKRYLRRHHKSKHDDAAEIFNCKLCDYKTKYKNVLLVHRIKHDASAENFQCELCNFKTKHKKYLPRHHRSKHEVVEIFHCPLCDFKTKNKGYLLEHHTLKHDDSPEILNCELCDYRTKDKNSLLRHRSKHDVAELSHCKLCDFKTKNKHYLLIHHRIKHDDAAETFNCKLCDFKTKNKCTLRTHHKIKHNDAAEIFHCKLCDFKTKYKNVLLDHRIKHDASAEIFQCALCDFKTRYKTCLRRHHRLKHDAAKVLHCSKTKDKYSLSNITN